MTTVQTSEDILLQPERANLGRFCIFLMFQIKPKQSPTGYFDLLFVFQLPCVIMRSENGENPSLQLCFYRGNINMVYSI